MTIYKGETSLETRKQAEELLAELRRQAYAEGYEQGFKQAEFDARMKTEWEDNVNPPTMDELMALGRSVLSETTQQKRDRIVEQAKKDVHSLLQAHSASPKGKTLRVYMNKEKRTIVAVITFVSSKYVKSRGIAKCAPDDCFNEHIGKAIALRRALGLEVPDEYLNAPQPTEVREGDVIRLKSGQTRTISHISTAHMNYTSGKCNSLDLVSKGYAEIIDDSESIAP